MNEVLYNINGKYFKDFGVYVSESNGLMDKPTPKPRKSYDWAEYHGKAVDLSKPKYDEREIELQGWVEGEDWADMKQNFDNLMAEFDKEGLARLVIEYLDNALVYDVYLDSNVELKKDFRKGKMIGVFKVKIKEPQPIKKVFKLLGNSLQLSFNSEKWVDINIDGINETQKGSVSINRTLADRTLSGYGYSGRNYLKNSNVEISNNEYLLASYNLAYKPKEGEEFLITLYGELGDDRRGFAIYNSGTSVKLSTLAKVEDGIYQATFLWKNKYASYRADNSHIRIYQLHSSGSSASRIEKVIMGKKTATDWTPAPEETHYITISGNIDEITNLQTNAEELWSL